MNERRYLSPLPEGRPRKREYVYAAVAVILMVAVHTADYSAAVVTETMVAERMPPATAFESRINLMRLTSPVRCEGRGGEQWIRQWGDGDLPPAIPSCVSAIRR